MVADVTGAVTPKQSDSVICARHVLKLVALLVANSAKAAVVLIVEFAACIVIILNHQLIKDCADQNLNLS